MVVRRRAGLRSCIRRELRVFCREIRTRSGEVIAPLRKRKEVSEKRMIDATRRLTPALLLLVWVGCAVDDLEYRKLNVAVVPFETRATFPYLDRIGNGVSELLADALYRTGQCRVLERGDLDAILSEQDLQHSGLTREEERVPPNRLKSVHYLVKGVVTDFSHVAQVGIEAGIGPFRLGKGGNYAIVGIALRVTEVESGEIVYSQVVDGTFYAGDIEVAGMYKGVSIGGHQFFRTPLGHALKRALDSAVDGIFERVERQIWRPVIAEVGDGRILITGGEDHRVRLDSRWHVRGKSRAIHDPATGDRLGDVLGDVVGTLRVVRVNEKFSYALVEEGGGFERGQSLEPANLSDSP